VRIAALRRPRHFDIEDVEAPTIGPDEVLVKVVASGVCASDLEPWLNGPDDEQPRYLGHEVSGVVVDVGDEVERPAVGERVGVWVTEAGFAEYVGVRAVHCFAAGEGPLHEALAEPISCAVNAVELADVRLGDDIVVVGAGFMGHLVQKLVALKGPRRLIVADARPEAIARAAAMGATSVVDVTREALPEAVRRLTDGRGADVTFECTGTQAALTTCGDTTRMSGTIAIVGFHLGGERTVPLAYWNWMAFRIVNAHFRDLDVIRRGMEVGMRLVSSRVLTTSDLVTHRFPLEHIDEAFSALEDKPPGFVKAVLTFPET
jgi:threonine dehydrogenase-like Zn-dependent dehydrogenase